MRGGGPRILSDPASGSAARLTWDLELFSVAFASLALGLALVRLPTFRSLRVLARVRVPPATPPPRLEMRKVTRDRGGAKSQIPHPRPGSSGDRWMSPGGVLKLRSPKLYPLSYTGTAYTGAAQKAEPASHTLSGLSMNVRVGSGFCRSQACATHFTSPSRGGLASCSSRASTRPLALAGKKSNAVPRRGCTTKRDAGGRETDRGRRKERRSTRPWTRCSRCCPAVAASSGGRR